MSRRQPLHDHWHAHICVCGTFWYCNKPDCRNTEDCTACEMQQQDEFFRARGDSAEQLEMPREQ